jgi:hypothetical protein
MSDIFQDGRTMITPASFGWSVNAGFNLPPAISTPLVNPMDPLQPANFDAVLAELFSFTPSVDGVQPSDTTHMPDNSGVLDPALYLLDLPPLMPVDQLTVTSFQPSLPNQLPISPMTGFATSGLQDISNANFINFAANAHDTISKSTWKDKRSIGIGALLSHILLCVLTTT